MNKKRILVTGGCGYVGCRVVLALAKKGYPVIVADKVKPEDRNLSFPRNAEFRHGDLRNPAKAQAAVKDADVVLHLAANIGSLTYMHNHQAEIIQENSAIDAALYPAIKDAGVKCIVYSSSSMVFQHAPCYPYKEEDLVKVNPPTNIYGLSKLLGEYFCKAYQVQYGIPYVIIRYHNIYGPGEDSKGETPGDIHVIPALIEKVLSGQYPLEILGDPSSTRPFTYVDDAVDATVRIVEEAVNENPQVLNNDFNIGTKEAIKILDLAELIWKMVGDNRPFKYVTKETKAVTALRREMDPEKIKSVIGWKATTPLEEGIKKTAEWIRTRGKKPFSLL